MVLITEDPGASTSKSRCRFFFELLDSSFFLANLRVRQASVLSTGSGIIGCGTVRGSLLGSSLHLFCASLLMVSFWISSLGTLHCVNSAHFLECMVDFKLLPLFTQMLPLVVFDRRCLWVNDHHAWTTMSIIPQLPWWIAWMTST